MAKIERFEDVLAWQKSRVLVKTIYSLTNSKPQFAKDFSLKDQMRRAAVSVMSNIAEGFARKTDKDFARFLAIALGSVTEIQSQLYVTLDLAYITEQEFNAIYEQASETARLITGFHKYLKAN